MSEYGLWSDEVDQVEQITLIDAWMRRKQFESKLLALEVGKMLFGAPEQTKKKKGASALFSDDMGGGETVVSDTPF